MKQYTITLNVQLLDDEFKPIKHKTFSNRFITLNEDLLINDTQGYVLNKIASKLIAEYIATHEKVPYQVCEHGRVFEEKIRADEREKFATEIVEWLRRQMIVCGGKATTEDIAVANEINSALNDISTFVIRASKGMKHESNTQE